MDSHKIQKQHNVAAETQDHSLNDSEASLTITGSWHEDEASTQLHELTVAIMDNGQVQVRRFGERRDILGIGITERGFALLQQADCALEFAESVRSIGLVHIGLVAANTPAEVEAKMNTVFSGRGTKLRSSGEKR